MKNGGVEVAIFRGVMQCPFVSVVRFAKNFVIFVVPMGLTPAGEHIF